MVFDEFTLEEAEGVILAHSIRLNSGTLKKGMRLTRRELQALAADGVERVFAARLDGSDQDEDTAAFRVACALAGSNLRLSNARTGRCNIFARENGLFVVDGDAVNRLNTVKEDITVATLPPFAPVKFGDMVATVKIIPFGVAAETVDAAVSAAGSTPPLTVAPFQSSSIGIILTQIEGGREGLVDKASRSLHQRLDRWGSRVVSEIRCNHQTDSVAKAIEQVRSVGCDVIVVCGAAATVDRRDTVPAAIEKAGGTVEHFGMPVDPGNLLLLGRLDGRPVIGMPGCARSPKTNGFDWVLQRILAGFDISHREIMGMGVGGLLDELPSRPFSRAGAADDSAGPGSTDLRQRIAAVILAAGQSQRMGRDNKLLADIDGHTMIRKVAEAATRSRADPVFVVTGHDREAIAAALDGMGVTIVHNPNFSEGMSGSIRSGLGEVPDDCEGAVICLGDMPGVRSEHINRLIDVFDPKVDRAICVSCHHGKRGNPVLWSRYFFEQLKSLEGDVGGRNLITKFEDVVELVEMEDPAVITDIDTLEALKKFSGEREA